MKTTLFALLLGIVNIDLVVSAASFVTQKSSSSKPKHRSSFNLVTSLSAAAPKRKKIDKEDKFSFQQRIESIKTAAVGAVSVCLLIGL